jgi:hypothetical protein
MDVLRRFGGMKNFIRAAGWVIFGLEHFYQCSSA